MRIFYAVQATGNGHISRAMELMPHLEQYGKVDVFLSGSNSTLRAELPVAFKDEGVSLYYTKNGRLNFLKTATHINPFKVRKTAASLPLHNYDLIINDFEAVTSWACKMKKLPSVHFGHQASFRSPKVPRPKFRDPIGELVLRHYAEGSCTVGLHFQAYDSFILPPVIKKQIWEAEPSKKGHITVYLPSFADEALEAIFADIKEVPFHIFSRQIKKKAQKQHLTFLPVDNAAFNESLMTSDGIITNAGFETPAEAIYLKKKVLTVPIQGQYEQFCNAAALQKMGYTNLPKIDKNFAEHVKHWLSESESAHTSPPFLPTSQIVEKMMGIATKEALIARSRR